MNFAEEYLEETKKVLARLDHSVIEKMVTLLADLRERGGRLFFLGVGGGAAASSHAVSDFRTIAGIESYTPADNVTELTAGINDHGWDSIFAEWLRESSLNPRDGIFVFSVGGGDAARGISSNIVEALNYARKTGTLILGVVGRDGGYTARVADACLVIPTVNPRRVTPHTEALQALVSHLIVSHPKLKISEMKWESENGPRLKTKH